ncbi:RNA polymerase sigma factor [Streptomyces sp. NPDC058914]|uniref:RNA polymerase sigma factor n=1 Tax=Streptomyces sp. NPDC058914 TaxID=3346671 RepID=UPI00369A2A97
MPPELPPSVWRRSPAHNSASSSSLQKTSRTASPAWADERPHCVSRCKEGIDELIDSLPEQQREVITLCILQDLSPDVVAQRLQIKEESVKRYIKAAANSLKKSINDHSEEVTV